MSDNTKCSLCGGETIEGFSSRWCKAECDKKAKAAAALAEQDPKWQRLTPEDIVRHTPEDIVRQYAPPPGMTASGTVSIGPVTWHVPNPDKRMIVIARQSNHPAEPDPAHGTAVMRTFGWPKGMSDQARAKLEGMTGYVGQSDTTAEPTPIVGKVGPIVDDNLRSPEEVAWRAFNTRLKDAGLSRDMIRDMRMAAAYGMGAERFAAHLSDEDMDDENDWRDYASEITRDDIRDLYAQGVALLGEHGKPARTQVAPGIVMSTETFHKLGSVMQEVPPRHAKTQGFSVGYTVEGGTVEGGRRIDEPVLARDVQPYGAGAGRFVALRALEPGQVVTAKDVIPIPEVEGYRFVQVCRIAQVCRPLGSYFPGTESVDVFTIEFGSMKIRISARELEAQGFKLDGSMVNMRVALFRTPASEDTGYQIAYTIRKIPGLS